MTGEQRRGFDYACEGLVTAIRRACDLPVRDDVWDGYVPYYGDVIGRAVWNAKFALRLARRLGLYPPTSQLEAECRSVA